MPQATTTPFRIDEDTPTIVLRRRARSTAAVVSTPYVLIVTAGRHRGEVIALRRGKNTIGRSLDAAVKLSDQGVSRQHAVIAIGRGGLVEVRDQGSTNGTFIDGRRVDVAVLSIGDRVQIGKNAALELKLVHRESSEVLSADDREDADAPVRRSRSADGARGASFLSTLYAIEPQLGHVEPCWGDSGDAQEAYERMLALRRKKLGPRHVAVGEVYDVMGTALRRSAQFERAVDCHRRAREIYLGHPRPLNDCAARSLARQAQCEIELGRYAESLASFEHAEELLGRSPAGALELACLRLSIARVLWIMQVNLERGLRLAQDAEHTFGTSTSAEPLRSEANRYVMLIKSAQAS